MSFLLEIVGPAVWRASWQASLLAGAVGLLLWFLDDRATPRWRYLLWSIVLIRFLLPITPAAPWSVFNLSFDRDQSSREPAGATGVPPVQSLSDVQFPPGDASPDRRTEINPARMEQHIPILTDSKMNMQDRLHSQRASGTQSVIRPSSEDTVETNAASFPWPITLTVVWLSGTLILIGRLIYSAIRLHRRLAHCQPVADKLLLRSLQLMCGRIGVLRTPTLMISPDLMTPCVVGSLRPRIVLPESSVSNLSRDQLQRILAHELGHLKRGDLWTNWLLLAARTLHWFNPIAWWTIRRLQEEREAACDDIALSQLPQAERNDYANTILELAASLSPNPLVPGMIGFFAPKQSLARRIRRLAHTPRVRPLQPSLMLMICAILAVTGLTDAGSPSKEKQESPNQAKADTADKEAAKPPDKANAVPAEFQGDLSFHFEVVDRRTGDPLPGVRVELVAVQGMSEKVEEVSTTTTNDQGEFAFKGVKHPFQYMGPDRLHYWIIASAKGRPKSVAWAPVALRGQMLIALSREAGTLNGRVVNAAGMPITEARIAVYTSHFDSFNIPELMTETDAQGRFTLENVPVIHPQAKWNSRSGLIIQHPDYVRSHVKIKDVPDDITITLNKGCTLEGVAIDKQAGLPSAETLITAVNVENGDSYQSTTDAAGEYTIHVPQGNYDILAYRSDRVAVAIKNRECPRGEVVALPDINLIPGGVITGRLVDGKTGEPVPFSESGHPNAVDLKGSSRPLRAIGRNIVGIVKVDKQGRFRLRAVPGENYPFVLTTRTDRMGWTIDDVEPVIVKSGEETALVIKTTYKETNSEKMVDARRVLERLPEDQTKRIDAILAEFRDLKDTVDQTEVWCLLMRELDSIGKAAVPQICAELDRATADRHIRRLAFALRAIGDPRAVLALIRAIPRTLVPSSSDYGLIVADEELTKFMQQHDLSDRSGKHFSFQRPPREVFGALRKLTGRGMSDERVPSLSLGDGPRRNAMIQKIYNVEAKRWAEWWNANSKQFVKESDYQTVALEIDESPIPPAKELTPNATAGDGGVNGQILSPPSESGKYVDHFMDLDTGLTPLWPDDIPQDKSAHKQAELGGWAAEHGVDLMCVTTPDAEGNPVYALYGFDLQAWQITHADVQNLKKRIEGGALKEGRKMSGLFIHMDDSTNEAQPRKHTSFFYITREGNMGVVEITDHITIAKDITGRLSVPTGVGFHKGVKFNHKIIVP